MAKKLAKGDVERFLPGLADEVITAAVHYQLYIDLRGSIKEFERELNQSRAFWSLTINAHLMTARAALFRAYDRSPDGLNLPRLIEVVGDHCKVARSEIDADRKLVSKDDPLVNRFLWQRNNLFAHKNLKNILTGRATEAQNSLTGTELETLLDRAVSIINKYDSDIRRHTWSTTMIGADDYMGVLKALRQSLKSTNRIFRRKLA